MGKPRPTRLIRLERHRVLLVEDHAPLAEATAEFMRTAGLEVRIASSGRDALNAVAAFKPEIVICDMNLPDMHGLDVARAMRTTPAGKNALIAIHSAFSQGELRVFERHSSEPAVNLFLSKPLTEEKLDALIAQLQVQHSAGRRGSE